MTPDALPSEFLERFVLNAAALLVLLRFVYYRFSPNRDSLFGFFLFGHGVYLISALMHDVEISMGFAFGLFAVLSMLRYRTESISIRDMTYLFLVIVLSLMSAVGPIALSHLVAMNAAVCLIVALSETTLFAPRTITKSVVYDDVANIRPERMAHLVGDLQGRLGVEVLHVEIGDVDLLKDSATLRVTLAGGRPTRAGHRPAGTDLLTGA